MLFFVIALASIPISITHAESKPKFDPIEWIAFPGGTFVMGFPGFADVSTKTVTVAAFEMSKTLVTNEQYAECVDKAVCTPPYKPSAACTWGVPGHEKYPVNCVSWYQAKDFARFKGARLPSEAEWEYAARGGGKDVMYPWGNTPPASCERAVMYGDGGYGCGTNGTMPVCSKPLGNTPQGLCDMAGNVWEWMEDKYEDTLEQTPADGSSYDAPGSPRVTRGGSYRTRRRQVTTRMRGMCDPENRLAGFGFRIVRSGAK